MSYAALTIGSRNPLKRFSHRRRFDTAMRLVALRDAETVLDYGTGDGYLLGLFKAQAPRSRVAGYDPFPDAGIRDVLLRHPDIAFSRDLDSFRGQRFAKVCCFETLEHFEGANLRRHVGALDALTAPGGRIHVSVPIEIGPPALVKNLVRAAIGKAHQSTTLANVLNAALYRPNAVQRAQEDAGGYIQSHVGFDHRAIPAAFAEFGFRPSLRVFAPLGGGAACNSQVFFVFERR